MTNPLSERLRKVYNEIGQHYGYVACIDEAADEIERLQAALAEMTAERDVWVKGFVREAYPLRASDEPATGLKHLAYSGICLPGCPKCAAENR